MHPKTDDMDWQMFKEIRERYKDSINFDSLWWDMSARAFPEYDCPCPDCGGIGDLNISSYIANLAPTHLARLTEDWIKANV